LLGAGFRSSLLTAWSPSVTLFILFRRRFYICQYNVIRFLCLCGGWGVDQNHTYPYGVLGREISKYTVIYRVYIRFWPTLGMSVTVRTFDPIP
jgi:hypothetical protein